MLNHFRSLLDHSPDGVLLLDLDGWNIVDANEVVAQTFGVDVGAIAGLPLGDVIEKETLQKIIAALRDESNERHCITATLNGFGLAGKKVEITLSSATVNDSRFGILILKPQFLSPGKGTNGVENDQHLEEEIQRLLREQEVRFQTLAESVPAGIFLADANGKLIFVNGLWTKITGLTLHQALHLGWLGWICSEDRQEVSAAWVRFVSGGGEFELEFRVQNPSGDIAWTTGRATPFLDEEGNTVGYLGTLVDISKRKQAELELVRSESEYRKIFENMIDVYYETTPDGEIIELSPSISNMSGFTREELIGRNMLEFYTKAGRRKELVDSLESSGAVHDFEIEVTNANGNRQYQSLTAKLERDENGEPSKIVGTMRDISQRKWAEDTLKAERHSLEQMAKGLPLYEFLESLTLTVESRAKGIICSILILEEGKRLRLAAGPSLPTEYNEAFDGIEIGPKAGSCGTAAFNNSPVIVSDVETDPLWVDFKDLALSHNLRSCWSWPILSSSGTVLGTFAVYRDKPSEPRNKHTQLIEGAAQLAAIAIEKTQANEEHERLELQVRQSQKLESLGVLAGGIAHDFNNLLTGIMGYASLAAFTLTEEKSEVAKQVGEIEKIAKRAADLVKQMLAYSGKGKFVVGPLNLSESAADMARLVNVSVSKKARLTLNFADDLPLIEADASQVQQVVMNLITNASEALGEETGEITISTGVIQADREYLTESAMSEDIPAGDYAYFEVADTGSGMDEETVSKIFDPFFTTKFTGRGLGMSAVLGIMQGHRGTIKIESKLGVGTTVRVLFPTYKLEEQPSESGAKSKKKKSNKSLKGTGMILVVDDEDFVRNMTRKMLEQAGYTVKTAADGVECLKAVEKYSNEIAAILLDLTMPGKDGVEVLRELRCKKSTIPVLISSGYSEQEVEKKLDGESSRGFVPKPFMRKTLLQKIKDILENKNL